MTPKTKATPAGAGTASKSAITARNHTAGDSESRVLAMLAKIFRRSSHGR